MAICEYIELENHWFNNKEKIMTKLLFGFTVMFLTTQSIYAAVECEVKRLDTSQVCIKKVTSPCTDGLHRNGRTTSEFAYVEIVNETWQTGNCDIKQITTDNVMTMSYMGKNRETYCSNKRKQLIQLSCD